jgi:hypothetical protein
VQARGAQAIIEANALAAHPELAEGEALLRRPIGSCNALSN